MQSTTYLGRGLKYPIVIDGGAAQWNEGLERVEQSIRTVLGSALTTYFMNRTFGSRLRQCLFEPNDDVLEALLDITVVEAIEKWEKRVELISSNYSHTDEVTTIKLTYKILASNEIDSFIYPFYKTNLIY